MDKFYIKGGLKLDGEAEVYSAKNAVLALLAASILTEEQVVIHKCPKINDVFSMIKILQSLGCVVEWQDDTIVINSSQADKHEIPQKYPSPGWVEQDPMDIYANQYAALTECIAKSGILADEICESMNVDFNEIIQNRLQNQEDNKIILYQDDNEITRVSVRFADEDLWLTQDQLAEIYCTTQENISMHIANIYLDHELDENRTYKKFLLVRQEGNRQVKRNIAHYNLDMIIALGYRFSLR